ncbi:phage holin family protein [Pontibacillus yanchengensis]|uniref:phage holin family protein n=1 Tax=Pontibacillus yanchengensis TaxID=462910 RepID=UPI00056BE165|nr:phage holin family protein [Pontibacillus yanchengensis]
MKNWLLHIIVNAIALIAVAQLFESFYLESFVTAIIASLILSVLNVIVKPILVVLTLPITFITLGLFLFVINAITLMITQALLGSSFVIDGFGIAILATIIISLLSLMMNQLVKDLK